MKNLYKIVICMKRETFIKYRYACSEKQAKRIGAIIVAKQHEVLPVVVMSYLKEHPDCYKITKEVEYKEIDD